MEIIGIILLATLNEGLINYLFGEGSQRAYLKYVSLVTGIALAISYRVDIPALVGLTADLSIIGYIVSGLIIGRGSNYLNDILGLIRSQG